MASIRDEIKFGTDGWRAVISEEFTFKNVGYVAQAISDWIKGEFKGSKTGKRKVAVGYDARFLSKEYADKVASILAANKITVYLSDAMVPTPALSYGVVHTSSICGIMITASHNPAKYNGIKIKTHQGGGAGRDITDKVERLLKKSPVKELDVIDALKQKKIIHRDFKKSYLTFMKRYVNLSKIKKSKFKVIQDVMHGSGGEILKEVLQGRNLKVDLMRSDFNPSFGGVKPEPIAEYVPELLKIMKDKKYDLGLIIDGDADRVAAVAPGGEFISPQRILALIALHLINNKGRCGGLVKTTCGSMIMDRIAQDLDCKLYETPVGFRYISDLMVSENIVAGGEEAGGIGVQDYIPERDGILAGLLLLEMMVYEKKNIKQLLNMMEKKYGRYYYERADLELRGNRFSMKKVRAIKSLLGKKVIDVMDYDGIKLTCEDESWLMLRPSGTEPLVRAYSEAKSLKRAKALITIGEKLLKA